jgi:hypothetical protein
VAEYREHGSKTLDRATVILSRTLLNAVVGSYIFVSKCLFYGVFEVSTSKSTCSLFY